MKYVVVIKTLQAGGGSGRADPFVVSPVTVGRRVTRHTEFYRRAEYTSFCQTLKIEVAVRSDQVDKVIEAISGAAKTGQIGDGKGETVQ
jgi:nitrogen regulatory protein PII